MHSNVAIVMSQDLFQCISSNLFVLISNTMEKEVGDVKHDWADCKCCCRATFSCSEQGSSLLSHCRETRVSSTPLSRRLLAGPRRLARHKHSLMGKCWFGRAKTHVQLLVNGCILRNRVVLNEHDMCGDQGVKCEGSCVCLELSDEESRTAEMREFSSKTWESA